MTTSKALGIDFGSWLNASDFDDVVKLSYDRFFDSPPAILFNHGWNGFGYRMRSAESHQLEFSRMFAYGSAPTPEERYQQDNHAFGFLANACSAAECVVFASHAAALGFSGNQISASHLKRSRKEMIGVVSGVSRTKQLGLILAARFADADSVTMYTDRDVFVHRGRTPQHQFASIGAPGPNDNKTLIAGNPKDEPAAWVPNREWNAHFLDPYVNWLTALVPEAIAELKLVLR